MRILSCCLGRKIAEAVDRKEWWAILLIVVIALVLLFIAFIPFFMKTH